MGDVSLRFVALDGRSVPESLRGRAGDVVSSEGWSRPVALRRLSWVGSVAERLVSLAGPPAVDVEAGWDSDAVWAVVGVRGELVASAWRVEFVSDRFTVRRDFRLAMLAAGFGEVSEAVAADVDVAVVDLVDLVLGLRAPWLVAVSVSDGRASVRVSEAPRALVGGAGS